MLDILYEDSDIIVVEKPVGMESQVSGGFAPDMVSEIKKHINKLCPTGQEPYVGVIHRLDKPVGGVMVYAKTKNAAGALSKQVQAGEMQKKYYAVVCGKPVDNVGNYVDYLLREGKTNFSTVVEKGTKDAKRAELRYHVLKTLQEERSLIEIELLTGRTHQIRVQFAAHGTPLWGDARYNPLWGGTLPVPGGLDNTDGGPLPQGKNSRTGSRREDLALAAVRLSLIHPVSGKRMEFSMEPKGTAFRDFA